MTLSLTVNGEEVRVDAQSVARLLDARGVDRNARGFAVAVNGAVVPRKDWEQHRLNDGDDIEIVKPFSGG